MSDTVHHLGDDLEAYALGMLDSGERAAVDEHVRSCDACSQRLGEAERTVVTMLDVTLAQQAPAAERAPVLEPTRVESLPSRGRRRAWPLRIATSAAALFALAAGLLGMRDMTLHAATRNDGELLHAMLASHFMHAQFRSLRGEPLDAKVLYERHGRWYAVLLAGSGSGLHVATTENAGAPPQVVPQTFVDTGGVALLRFAATRPVATLQLVDREDHVVGTVATPKTGGR